MRESGNSALHDNASAFFFAVPGVIDERYQVSAVVSAEKGPSFAREVA